MDRKWIIPFALVLLGPACNPAKVSDKASVSPTPAPSPSPSVVTSSFRLEGTVISVKAASPAASPGALSPSPSPSLGRASLGALTIQVTSYEGSQTSACKAQIDDRVVVAYSDQTVFPAAVKADPKFPGQLADVQLTIEGDILELAKPCLMLAKTVTQNADSASPHPDNASPQAPTKRRSAATPPISQRPASPKPGPASPASPASSPIASPEPKASKAPSADKPSLPQPSQSDTADPSPDAEDPGI